MNSKMMIVAGLLALASACAKAPVQVPKPEVAMVVDIRSEPSRATVTFQGKDVGSTPKSMDLANVEDVLNIGATRDNDSPVEKRIRFLALDKAEVIFIFGSGHSAMAKALGFPKILVFDYGAGFTFDVDKFDIKPEFQPFLLRQAQMLNKYFPTLDIHVCGHTDSTGNSDHNLKLSLDRAQSVADALAGKAVEKSHLKIQGLGSQYPLVPNDTPEKRALNRRTEIILGQ